MQWFTYLNILNIFTSLSIKLIYSSLFELSATPYIHTIYHRQAQARAQPAETGCPATCSSAHTDQKFMNTCHVSDTTGRCWDEHHEASTAIKYTVWKEEGNTEIHFQYHVIGHLVGVYFQVKECYFQATRVRCLTHWGWGWKERMEKGFSRKECLKLSCEREVSQVKKGDHEEEAESTGGGGCESRQGLHMLHAGAGGFIPSASFKLYALELYGQICIVDFSLWWY